MQAGMLFHALKDPASPAYTVQLALQLAGEVDPVVLAAAWRTVLARHAALRTSFLWDDVPEPLQVVHRAVPFGLAHHDWSGLADANADARFTAFLHDDRHTPLDLRAAPLLRVALVRLPGGATWMVQTEHHIVSDGWSGPLVLADLAAAYTAHRAGLRPALPAPAPYERYIAWLTRQDPAAAEAFFRRYLEGLPGPTRLGLAPTATTPDPAREHTHVDVCLTAAETATLSAFTRRHGLTVSTVLQGVLALVLGLHAGRRDVVFGVTTAGRAGSLFKLIPFAGMLVGTVGVSVTAAALTQAIGDLFIMHYEAGGTLLTFDVEAMRAHFRKEYDQARITVRRIQRPNEPIAP